MRGTSLYRIQHDECSTFFFPFGFTFRIPFIELSNGWTQFNWEQSGAREGAEKGGDDVMFRQRSTKFQMCKEKTVHAFVWCVLWRLFSVEWENVWEKLMMSISEGNNQKNKLNRKPAWIRIYIYLCLRSAYTFAKHYSSLFTLALALALDARTMWISL